MPKPTRSQKLAFRNLQKVDPNAEVSWDEKIGTPVRLRGVLSSGQVGVPQVVALQFLTANRAMFALESPQEELKLKDIHADSQGNRHLRFQQMYRGLPVFGSELVVHMDSENAIRGTSGRFVPRINVPSAPKVSAEEAKKAMLAHAPDNREIPGRVPILLVHLQDDKVYLAWHMTVQGSDKALDGSKAPAEWAYFVDALTGKVIWGYNSLPTHTRTTGTGTGRYAGAVTLNTFHNHTTTTYELEDQWVPLGARIRTRDCGSGTPPSCGLSTDNNNAWAASGQGAEVDCHHFSRTVFDYYLLMHGRNSYDDAGADMEIHAHVGTSYNNAYWSPGGQYVAIGDGDGTAYTQFCTLDMVAHEWTHAVTEHTAGLIYYGESGALNESMSDVFGALIDGDWLHGEDNWLATTAPAGRNLADPTNGGQYDPANPITSVLAGHQPDHWNDRYIGLLDNGGVHINSGIMNKAAYLIATGGTHRGITICDALGTEVLGRLYYQALTSHLTSSSNLTNMRDAALDSLDDLYTGDPRYARWRAAIINAFAAVGIGSAVVCPGVCWVSPFFCPPKPTLLCPPKPMLLCPPSPTLACPPSPTLLCPPSPTLACPPSPSLLCPPAPRGCLPGPDPAPFIPRIERQPPEMGKPIRQILGIGRERAALLESKGISTIAQFMQATETDNTLKSLARATGFSVRLLTDWRTKGQQPIGRK